VGYVSGSGSPSGGLLELGTRFGWGQDFKIFPRLEYPCFFGFD